MKLPSLEEYALPKDGKTTYCCFLTKKFITFCTLLIKSLSLRENPLILDAGTGTGLGGMLLADEGLRVYGIDDRSDDFDASFKHENLVYVDGVTIDDIDSLLKNNGLKLSYKEDREKSDELLTQSANGLLCKLGVEDIDAIFCSYMPYKKNWMPVFEKINPQVIINIIAPKQYTGDGSSSYVSKNHMIIAKMHVESFLNINNYVKGLKQNKKQSFSHVYPAWGLVQVRNGTVLESNLVSKLKEIANSYSEQYPWEKDLEELEKKVA